ncbi:cell wall metabolism sensor histidine kinase VicK, partial [Streptococcus pyogenes]
MIATDRMGRIIMINDMAQKQLSITAKSAEQIKLLDLLDIEEDYSFRDLLAQTPEVVIDHA